MEAQSSDSSNRQLLILIGVVLIAVAVAVIVVSKGKSDSGCVLATAGVTSIAEGLSHGHDTEEIVKSGAEELAPKACEQLVETFVEEPAAPADFTLDSPTEGNVGQSTTGLELIEPVAEPRESSSQRIIDCFFSYPESEFLDQLCTDGAIEPTYSG